MELTNEETEGIPMTENPDESVPSGEVPVTDKEEEFDWSPLENPKILTHLDKLGSALVGIKLEAYRNSGKSDYIGFRISKMRGVCFIYTSVNGARVSCGETITDESGKTKGSFPKDLIFRVGEDGITRDGEKVKTSEIIAQVKRYVKERGW